MPFERGTRIGLHLKPDQTLMAKILVRKVLVGPANRDGVLAEANLFLARLERVA